jgi:glutaryl-CoA dehydrogenase
MSQKTPFRWDDPLLLQSQLSTDEKNGPRRGCAHQHAQSRLAPRILEAFREEKTDTANHLQEMGESGPSQA